MAVVLVGLFLLRGGRRVFGTVGQGIRVVEVVAVFFALEHRVGLQGLLDLLLQIQGGQLE
ncbi:hypothetical protein D9M70_634480 [compost metagenome]